MVWIKHSGLKQICWIVKRLMKIPPKEIRDGIRIAGIGHTIPKLQGPGPGHDYGKRQKSCEDETIANDRATSEQWKPHGRCRRLFERFFENGVRLFETASLDLLALKCRSPKRVRQPSLWK